MTGDPHRSIRPRIWRHSDEGVVVLSEVVVLAVYGNLKMTIYLRNGEEIVWEWPDKKTRDSIFSSLSDAVEMFHAAE